MSPAQQEQREINGLVAEVEAKTGVQARATIPGNTDSHPRFTREMPGFGHLPLIVRRNLHAGTSHS